MPIPVVVRYAPRQYASEVPPDLWEGLTVDISRNGVAFELYRGLRHGGAIELSLIRFNPPHCVSVVGKVVHCRRIPGGDSVGADGTLRARYRAGVEFNHLLKTEDLVSLEESRSARETNNRAAGTF